MLSIAIYDDNKESVLKIKDAIQDYLIETHTLAKVSCFDKAEEFHQDFYKKHRLQLHRYL